MGSVRVVSLVALGLALALLAGCPPKMAPPTQLPPTSPTAGGPQATGATTGETPAAPAAGAPEGQQAGAEARPAGATEGAPSGAGPAGTGATKMGQATKGGPGGPRAGGRTGGGMAWMDKLTADQKKQVDAKMKEMRDKKASPQESMAAVRAMAKKWGVTVPERGMGFLSRLNLTADQRKQVEAKVKEMTAKNASRDDIRKAVGDMLKGWGIAMPERRGGPGGAGGGGRPGGMGPGGGAGGPGGQEAPGGTK
jgi:translation initiation factor IF-2